MKTSQKGIDLIKSFEGLRNKPYLDVVGIPTIGIGSTRYEDDSKVTMQDPEISDARAEELLHHALAVFEAGINKLVIVEISQNQFDAVACFCYNIGLGNFEKSTMLKKINLMDDSAADEFARWNKAGGHVVDGLTRRRAAEADLFRAEDENSSGESSDNGGDVLPEGPSDDEILKKLKGAE